MLFNANIQKEEIWKKKMLKTTIKLTFNIEDRTVESFMYHGITVLIYLDYLFCLLYI